MNFFNQEANQMETHLNEPFRNITDPENNKQNYHPLSTGRKSQQYKNALSRVLSGGDQGET
jgi:hypothetical protein